MNYWEVTRDPSVLDDPAALPTFEGLGRFSAFLACIEPDISIMADRVQQLREMHHAAAVRMADDAR